MKFEFLKALSEIVGICFSIYLGYLLKKKNLKFLGFFLEFVIILNFFFEINNIYIYIYTEMHTLIRTILDEVLKNSNFKLLPIFIHYLLYEIFLFYIDLMEVKQ